MSIDEARERACASLAELHTAWSSAAIAADGLFKPAALLLAATTTTELCAAARELAARIKPTPVSAGCVRAREALEALAAVDDPSWFLDTTVESRVGLRNVAVLALTTAAVSIDPLLGGASILWHALGMAGESTAVVTDDELSNADSAELVPWATGALGELCETLEAEAKFVAAESTGPEMLEAWGRFEHRLVAIRALRLLVCRVRTLHKG